MQGIYNGVTTWELDTLAAETCAYMNTEHPHYARLAARISVSNLQRATSPSFVDTVDELYRYQDPKTGRQGGYISDEVRCAENDGNPPPQIVIPLVLSDVGAMLAALLRIACVVLWEVELGRIVFGYIWFCSEAVKRFRRLLEHPFLCPRGWCVER